MLLHQSQTRPLPALAHIAALDGLRGVAVLLVVWQHVPPVTGSAFSAFSARLAHIVNAGYFGVNLFFVLSGFLITRILLHERFQAGRISYRTFYLKRTLRIFPIYYLTLLATLPFLGAGTSFSVFNILYIQNYYAFIGDVQSPLEHTWSLAVEEQFYLIWPWLMASMGVAAGRFATGFAIPAISLAAAAAIVLTVPHDAAQALLYCATPVRMIALSFGAYLAYRERAGQSMTVGGAAWLSLAGVALLLGVSASHATGLLAGGDYYRTLANAGLSLLSAGCVALVLAPRAGWTVPLRAICAGQPLRYVGRISYGLYLYHYVVLSSLNMIHLEDGGTRPMVPVLAAIAASFLIAALSYELLEAPIIRWGRRALVARRYQPGPAVLSGD